jgi:hypothetical protein
MSQPRTRLYLGGAALLLAGVALLGLSFGFRPPPSREAAEMPEPEPAPTPGLPWFVDVTAAAGIDFRHFDSITPMHYIQETMGSGVAWIDYDDDGWPDLFFVQVGPVRPGPKDGPPPTAKLYRNNGDGTFTDVTRRVGLDRPGYGMGVAVGDFDNDGFDDLVVTYLGGLVLYHNEPDGKGGRRFVDVTARAGLHNPHWGTSCGWGDIDGDGLLDLYVCNYVVVDFASYPVCEDKGLDIRTTCSPILFANVPHKLFRNNGDGTFTDISVASGVAAADLAPGLGVVMCDLDGDGKLDIYVANDMKPGYLFHNQGGGRFVEKALLRGCGLDGAGRYIAGMGVEAGDLDGSGRPSLFVTNYQGLPNIFFRNVGNLTFQDHSYPSGLGGPSVSRLGFGTALLDADLDGHLDVAVANGHVEMNAHRLLGVGAAQQAQFFVGDGKGRFRDLSDQAGKYFREARLGRGLACADFDNDGRPDLVFSNNAGRPALLHNRTETGHGWLRLELIGDGKKSNRNAVGARVEVEAGGKRQVRFVNGGGSYLSASERRLLIGLGKAARAARVTVVWPSGRKQEFRDLEGRRGWRLREGQDRPELAVPRVPNRK